MKRITTQNETLEAARARNIADALAEDIGTGDWTAQLVPANQTAHAKLIVRQSAVLCGTAWFEGVVHALDPKAVIAWQYAEGDIMRADSTVCTIDADARALLSAERPAMNFLPCHGRRPAPEPTSMRLQAQAPIPRAVSF